MGELYSKVCDVLIGENIVTKVNKNREEYAKLFNDRRERSLSLIDKRKLTPDLLKWQQQCFATDTSRLYELLADIDLQVREAERKYIESFGDKENTDKYVNGRIKRWLLEQVMYERDRESNELGNKAKWSEYAGYTDERVLIEFQAITDEIQKIGESLKNLRFFLPQSKKDKVRALLTEGKNKILRVDKQEQINKLLQRLAELRLRRWVLEHLNSKAVEIKEESPITERVKKVEDKVLQSLYREILNLTSEGKDACLQRLNDWEEENNEWLKLYRSSREQVIEQLNRTINKLIEQRSFDEQLNSAYYMKLRLERTPLWLQQVQQSPENSIQLSI